MKAFCSCLLVLIASWSLQSANLLCDKHLADDSTQIKQRHFYLQNIFRPGKTVQVSHRPVTMFIKEAKKDTGEISRYTMTECLFQTIKYDSVVVRLLSEETDIEYHNYFRSISTNYFEGSYDNAYRTIAIRNVQYINMKSHFRQSMTRVGGVIMSLSIITLVSAPFTGLKLSGDDRAAARGQVFLTGLSGIAVSIPFFIIGRNKKYGMSPEYQTSKSNYWTIQEKFDR